MYCNIININKILYIKNNKIYYSENIVNNITRFA